MTTATVYKRTQVDRETGRIQRYTTTNPDAAQFADPNPYEVFVTADGTIRVVTAAERDAIKEEEMIVAMAERFGYGIGLERYDSISAHYGSD